MAGMEHRHVWHLWPSRRWPASAAEESDLIEGLRETVDEMPLRPLDGPTELRVAATALVNILRGGCTWQEASGHLPGLDPRDVISAYDVLERRRSASHAACLTLLDTSTALDEETLESASRLLPVVAARIAELHFAGAHEAADAVRRRSLEQVRSIAALVLEVESRLEDASGERALLLGERLHDPVGESLWSSAHYLPRRATDLSPRRVADLIQDWNPTP